jgi:DNA polymerase-1
MPDQFWDQFALCLDCLHALNMRVVCAVDGFEADDMLATYARLGLSAGLSTEIVSPDKDLLQLINDTGPTVRVYNPFKNIFSTAKEVQNKYGVLPARMAEYQALAGDPGDGIPGVKGIGPKTAAKLLAEYKTLEGVLQAYESGEMQHDARKPFKRFWKVLAAADASASPALQPGCVEGGESLREQVQRCLALTTLEVAIDVTVPIEEGRCAPADPAVLQRFLETQGFASLLSAMRLPVDGIPGRVEKAPVASSAAFAASSEGDLWFEGSEADTIEPLR